MALESDRSFGTYERRSRTSRGRALRTNVDLLGAGHARRAVRVSDSLGSIAFLDPHGVRSARHPASSRRFDSCRQVASCARMSWKAMRGWCHWIRAGTRRCCASSSSGSSTFSMARTTCCSCFCLVIPFRRIWTLVPIVTAFTVAHSITLIASAYNYAPGALWFPPLIETLIATSIVYMALENIVGRDSPRRRWIITFLFGLVHGFGFSFGLQHTLQFAGLAPADIAAVVQHRRGARAAAGAGADGARARHPLPLRRGRAHGHHHPVGHRRATPPGTG